MIRKTYPPGTVIPYFEDFNKTREVAYWAKATQLQVERWEPLVAMNVGLGWKKDKLSAPLYWQMSIERHLALVAADHLFTAMNFAKFPVHIDETLRVEISAGRDLVEHWKENMPIFNVHPRPTQPKHPSGKEFAARNPRSGPYDPGAWDNQVGPKLLPNVPAERSATRGECEGEAR